MNMSTCLNVKEKEKGEEGRRERKRDFYVVGSTKYKELILSPVDRY